MLKYVLTSVVDLEELWLSLTGSPSGGFISDMAVTNKYFWRNMTFKSIRKLHRFMGILSFSDVQNTKLQLSQVVNN